MRVGTFLIITIALFALIMGLEVWLYYQRKHETISELAREHQGLRWLIELGILLFGIWWLWHSGTLR